jgi:hypothetical protein
MTLVGVIVVITTIRDNNITTVNDFRALGSLHKILT